MKLAGVVNLADEKWPGMVENWPGLVDQVGVPGKGVDYGEGFLQPSARAIGHRPI